MPSNVDTQAHNDPFVDRILRKLFLLVVATYCFWIFSIPIFPTQDGPVHLYYVSALKAIANGSPLFSQYFGLRHPVPPYAVHYLLLYLLFNFVSPLVAEKVVVCITILLFAFGAQFLMRSVTNQSWLGALTLLPLALNWMVGMGFHNYCLSLGLSLFAIGVWQQARRKHSVRLFAAFLLSIGVMLFTHPIPVLITIGIASATVVASATWEWLFERRTWRWQTFSLEFIALAIACLSVGYIFLFISKAKTAASLHHSLIQVDMLNDFSRGRPLMLISSTVRSKLYTFWLFVLLGCSVVLGLFHLLRRLTKESLGAKTIFVAGVSLLLAFPVIPRSMNGSDFFADRLAIYIWIFTIVGVASAVKLSSRTRLVAGSILALVAASVPGIDDREIRSASRQLAQIENASRAQGQRAGVFIFGPVYPPLPNLTFDPLIWSATRYFRETQTIMLNPPWLDLPIMPIDARGELFTNLMPGELMDYPDHFEQQFSKSAHIQELVRSKADFIVQVGSNGTDGLPRNPAAADVLPGWPCMRTQWFAICQPGSGR